ncbi:hypothetical protein P154DRAFT_500105 [Amniculicola lignicola CBS 123094]|uniref:PQ-loop-domain-containing protein n=1 Tax=Amniculicola lignicola CBS 123094 TaxID=1392246 RepID=A0A6A5WD54_9PLEO|nr:hypothetical protein P154DRAFT_500105 [Amniculicola lignicola CBS 123094]
MPPYLSPLHFVEPALPAHCEPANEFLYHLSSSLHTCVPTNLAFLSTVLGTCSILSWLFAQLPQIYKNWQLKSTSGLSIFFLAEWLLGDLSNLLGSLFTQQALWQVIIACYYVSVDCALCAQWVWYQLLHHGRPLRPAYGSSRGSDDSRQNGMQEVWEGGNGGTPSSDPSTPTSQKSPSLDIKGRPPSSSERNIPQRANHPNRPVTLGGGSSPMPSPKTILYISLILAVLSNSSTATPLSPFAPTPYRPLQISARSSGAMSAMSASEIAGKVLSWMSTILYLGSRLPQLYKNHVRKSTAGLSPTLFAAAFFGNLFYSTSLLTNPCAWNDYASGEGAGWVGPEGSDRADWVLRATPFFLGAAGVLVMDAAVGFQFWYFGEGKQRGRPKTRDEEVIVVLNDGLQKSRRWRWHRVSGWMRGWVPAVSVAGTPSVSRAGTPSETPRATSPSPIPGRGGSGSGSALEEARALLGTERNASPRSYGT